VLPNAETHPHMKETTFSSLEATQELKNARDAK